MVIYIHFGFFFYCSFRIIIFLIFYGYSFYFLIAGRKEIKTDIAIQLFNKYFFENGIVVKECSFINFLMMLLIK